MELILEYFQCLIPSDIQLTKNKRVKNVRRNEQATAIHPLIVEEYLPDEVAIEAPFFGKNVQSMLKLGRAQGVAMAAALMKDLPIVEYSPRKVKQAITGNGNSSKEQVAAMIQSILKLKTLPKELDATDGIAVAICHHFQYQFKEKASYTSWKDFATKNKKRIN